VVALRAPGTISVDASRSAFTCETEYLDVGRGTLEEMDLLHAVAQA
jgi:hypothetical protein